jgi:hypothetical protein
MPRTTSCSRRNYNVIDKDYQPPTKKQKSQWSRQSRFLYLCLQSRVQIVTHSVVYVNVSVMLWTASSLKLSSYICPGQHRAPGEITMLFSIKVLYLTIDGTTINLYPLRLHIQHCEWLFEQRYLFKNFMIKVKEGEVICGACRLRHYKCRPCSDRQATCEHYVVSLIFWIKF